MSAVYPSTAPPIDMLMVQLVHRLESDFASLPKVTVERCVADARVSATTAASPAAYIAAVESLARASLDVISEDG